MRNYQDPIWLAKTYLDKGWSLRRIAALFRVAPTTVLYFMRRYGIARRPTGCPRETFYGHGTACPRYGGGHVRKDTGYVVEGWGGKQVRQHRRVAAEMLGRPLRPEEVVHHKNGNHSNNRKRNLEVFPDSGSHLSFHAQTRGRLS